jgi:cell division protein FtsB
MAQGFALCLLLIMLAVAIAGPSGLLAWGENGHLLEQRQQEIHKLAVERDELRNRVHLLDPRHADPDLAGELLRKNLNVAHPDEMIMMVN